MRLGSANTYDNALQNIYARQNELSTQQEKLTSGKNINRVSDDPTGAAQAERAMTRITRVATEQRALELQRNSITMAESTLGDATSTVQDLRELVVSAGNGGFNARDRATIAQKMAGLRDQLFAQANRTDTNGIPLFGGLGGPSAPFIDVPGGVTFNGIAGQRASTEISVPGAMNGQAIWMNVPSGNGSFNVALPELPSVQNTGTLWTDPGQVISPTALTGNDYSVEFSVAAGVTTYNVFNDTLDPTHAGVPLLAAQPYIDGQAIEFDGMSFVAHGAPSDTDKVLLSGSTPINIFQIIDDAIKGIDGAASDNKLSQSLALSLKQIDAGMDRIQAARGQAGHWLNQADNIENTQSGRTVQLSADKSRAEDLDMVKGISDFSKFQTGYQAALQSYAQVQKLSLFNYIS
jgi:flagellar hook-associated protein 3 FlgL